MTKERFYMQGWRRIGCALGIVGFGFGLGMGTAVVGAQPLDSFRSLMEEAMRRMHRDMEIPYSGDADRDFAAMMIPHHQGAIDMALLELRFGRDARLRRLAHGIVVVQLQEIAVMKQVLADLPPPRAVNATPSAHDPSHHKN
jgi:hypothetical protein